MYIFNNNKINSYEIKYRLILLTSCEIQLRDSIEV